MAGVANEDSPRASERNAAEIKIKIKTVSSIEIIGKGVKGSSHRHLSKQAA
jgi:hypothetical protein